MTAPTIADYLKYANLQMAAEAFIYDEDAHALKTGQQLISALNYSLSLTPPRHISGRPLAMARRP